MQTETFTPELDFNRNMQHLYQDLYASLKEGLPLAITPESVYRQITVLEKCRAMSPVYPEVKPGQPG